MRLAQRLLLGAVLIVSVLMILAVVLSDQRLSGRLERLTTTQLGREARLIARQWSGRTDSDALADSAGAALGHRVTLVDSGGSVIGDSEFDGAALVALQNHGSRPEIVEALRSGMGTSKRVSPSEGDEELYVAVASGRGRVARVSIGTTELHQIVAGARGDVFISGLIALLVAVALAAVFSRQVTAPVQELRDVTSAIAAGDLSRRPSLSAPGEIGDLAVAVSRMSEQLASRLNALQADDDLLEALIESLDEGVVAVDAQKRVIRINASGRRLLDAPVEVPFSVDLLPRDRVLHDAIAQALSGAAAERAETHIAGRILAVTARPLAVGGAVLALFDLTSVRKLEAVRRDFVANVSHELKTPLTAIRGFAETLGAELADVAQHRQFADTIRANAERMQRLVDDLLDLSRIESGGWRPTPSPVDVATAVSEIVATYQRAAEERGNRIAVVIDRDATVVRVDPTALRQVLVNLVENAVRYTAKGTITLFSRRDNGGVVVGVRDTGSGIPAEHLPRIFERFYRVDAARSRAAGGTGLGLAIVKHLVEAHGGRVGAESTPGRGTAISVFLPDGS
ncbi:MAG TPA: ATP-binding protein [Gemmatimonadaceae bacterium]|nr:ATP-binding protein [Gemmatimonadaceae bacterium]